MVNQPELTTDDTVKLTTEEIDMLQSLLDAHDRGGFYMAYNAMTDSGEAGLQSRIATFTGLAGGAAMVANRIVQETAPGYPGIYVLSQNVAQSGMDAIKSANDLSAGKITDDVFFKSAAAAWKDAGYPEYFPGNLLTGTLTAVGDIASAVGSAFQINWGSLEDTPENAAALAQSTRDAVDDVKQLFSPGAWAAFAATLLANQVGKSESDMGGYTKIAGPNGYDIYVDGNGHVGATINADYNDALALAGFATITTAFALVPGGTLLLRELGKQIAEIVHPPQYGSITPSHYTEFYTGGFNGDTHSVSGPTAEPDRPVWHEATTSNADVLFTEAGSVSGDGGDDVLFGGGGDNTLNGDAGNDIIWGRGGADKLDGGAGDDVLRGGAGGDYIKGGEGDDVLDGGDINIPAAQDNAADVLDGGEGNDYLYGGGGNDTLVGGDGADKLYGGADADVLVIGNIDGVNAPGSVTGSEVMEGGAGTDYLVVTGAVGDTVKVGKGDAQDRLLIHSDFLGLPNAGGGKIGMFALLGGIFEATPYDLDGVELLTDYNEDSNLFTDSNGEYRVYYYTAGSYNGTELSHHTLFSDAPFVIEYRKYASNGQLNIRLLGQNEDYSSDYSSTPDDTTRPVLQTITIKNFSEGDYGIMLPDVFLPYGSLNEGFYYGGVPYNFDGSVLEARDAAAKAISDTALAYSLTSDGTFQGAGLRAALTTSPTVDAVNLKIAIDGKDGADTLRGNDVAEVISGDTGNDTLYGNGGGDSINGGEGTDRMIGGSGADRFDGGSGVDTVDYRTSKAGVVIDLVAGTGSGGDATGDSIVFVENVAGSQHADTIRGDDALNRLQGFDGADKLFGGGGNDRLIGGLDADVLEGGTGTDVVDYSASSVGVLINLAAGTGLLGDAAGDMLIAIENVDGSAFGDVMTGDAGINRLNGLAGNDTLNGMAGNDYLVGDLGNDSMTGGAGADVFVFAARSGHDVISDFWAGPHRPGAIHGATVC